MIKNYRELIREYSDKHLLWLDKVLAIAVFALFGVFQPDILLAFTFLAAFFYLVLTKRTSLYYHLYVSTVLFFIWMLFSAKQYGYNQDFMQIYGVTLFPFFAGTLGMFAIYLVYSHYEKIYRVKGYVKQLSLFTAIYWPILLIVEKIGYEVFNIKNMAAIDYDPLPICNCLHAAPWMQVTYLLVGPLFFTVCYVLKLDEVKEI